MHCSFRFVSFLLPCLFACITFLSAQSALACDRSAVTLDSIIFNSQNYTIYTTLCIGGGITGTTFGSDAATRTFAFSFYGTPSLSVLSFTPALVTSDSTMCGMPGGNLGPVSTFGSQQTIGYLDQGCPNGFTCRTSTIACGNVHTDCKQYSFTVNQIPDSIRMHGVEGDGNPFAGCYPDPDMLIFFGGSGCGNDTQGPTITCPANQSVVVNANCQAVVPSYAQLLNAVDNCDPNPTVTQTPPPGTSLIGLGSAISVSMFATDASMNSSSNTCNFTATAVDQSPPTLSCPSSQTVALDTSCNASLPNYATLGSISDNCDPNPSINSQSPSPNTVISSPTQITLFGTDASSNAASCTFIVNVADTLPPSILCPPTTVLVLDTSCQATLPSFISLAPASDNCGVPTVTQSPTSGSTLTQGSTQVVTLTATDASSNTITCTFVVNTVDTIAPQIVCPGNQTITPTTLICNPAVTWTAPQATDNCPSPQVSSTQNPGDNFPLGTTTVTYTALDADSNMAQCNFTITVNMPQLDNMIFPSTTAPCQGDTVTLAAMPGLSSYNWSTSATSANIEVTTAGWYWVDLTDANNCSGRDSIWVDFLPLPAPVIAQSGNALCTGTFSTYQWYENGNLIPGATSNCFTPVSNGNYTVVVSDSNGCTNESAPLMFVNLDAQLAGPGFDLFPNPAQQVVKVAVHQAIQEPGRILVYDLAGRVVLIHDFASLSNVIPLQLGEIPEGSYIVEIAAGELRGHRRLVHFR